MSNCFELNDGTAEGILDETDDGNVGTSFGAELGGVEIAAMGDLLGFIDNEGPPEGCADTLGMIDGAAEGLTDNEGMFDGAPDGIADKLGM